MYRCGAPGVQTRLQAVRGKRVTEGIGQITTSLHSCLRDDGPLEIRLGMQTINGIVHQCGVDPMPKAQV
jgi:hypothetical protein